MNGLAQGSEWRGTARASPVGMSVQAGETGGIDVEMADDIGRFYADPSGFAR